MLTYTSTTVTRVLCRQDPAAPSRAFRQRVRRLPLPHVRLPHRAPRGVHPPRQLLPEPGVDAGGGTRHAVETEEAHGLRGSKRPGNRASPNLLPPYILV